MKLSLFLYYDDSEVYRNSKHNNQRTVVNDFGYDLLYDMAQQYGHAQLVWYALNGTRVVEGEYTDKD